MIVQLVGGLLSGMSAEITSRGEPIESDRVAEHLKYVRFFSAISGTPIVTYSPTVLPGILSSAWNAGCPEELGHWTIYKVGKVYPAGWSVTVQPDLNGQYPDFIALDFS